MKRVLITGMSGVGKSTVAARLAELGYKAVDTSYDGYSVVGKYGAQRWDHDRIRRLLETEDADVLFVVGTNEDQGQFYSQFDHVVLLSAPRETVVERLAKRTNNAFGKRPAELAKVLSDTDTYEPMMRRSATHEIDTNKPVDQVIDEIFGLLG